MKITKKFLSQDLEKILEDLKYIEEALKISKNAIQNETNRKEHKMFIKGLSVLINLSKIIFDREILSSSGDKHFIGLKNVLKKVFSKAKKEKLSKVATKTLILKQTDHAGFDINDPTIAQWAESTAVDFNVFKRGEPSADERARDAIYEFLGKHKNYTFRLLQDIDRRVRDEQNKENPNSKSSQDPRPSPRAKSKT